MSLKPAQDMDKGPMMDEDTRIAADAAKFHQVMSLLSNLQMPHGTCRPRERRACTHCNARDDLDKMLAEYKGIPVQHQVEGVGRG